MIIGVKIRKYLLIVKVKIAALVFVRQQGRQYGKN